MARSDARPETTRRPRKTGGPFLAVAAHEREDGSCETLRLTAEEVAVIQRRRGQTVRRAIPLRDLTRVRTQARVKRLELLIALSYLLGASVFLYLIVNMVHSLSDGSIMVVLGVLVLFAAVGVAAAWLSQEAVVQFIARGRHKRLEYRLDEGEERRWQVLEPFTRLQQK